MRSLLLAIILSLSTPAFSQVAPSDAATDSGSTDVRQTDTHPVLSSDAHWAGSVVIGVLGLFLAAMVIGPLVQAETIEEPPMPSDHDDHSAHHH